MNERLQKLIAQAGLASRRKAEEMLLAGRVAVNGQTVTALGSKADWERDHISVDGKLLRPAATTHHLLFYKPKGVVTTLSDPEGRPTIREFMRGIRERLYPVGRLDFHSEGLLLLTNDGALANQVLSASSALPKTYWVKVAGVPSEEHLERLRRGVVLDGRRTAPAQIRRLGAGVASGRERQRAGVYRTSTDNPWLEVVLIEGRNHQIRKMFLSVGHPVEKLKRVAIGPLTIGGLKPGQMRPLSAPEVAQLRQAGKGEPHEISSPRWTGGGRHERRETLMGAGPGVPSRRTSAPGTPASPRRPLDRPAPLGKRGSAGPAGREPMGAGSRGRNQAGPRSTSTANSAGKRRAGPRAGTSAGRWNGAGAGVPSRRATGPGTPASPRHPIDRRAPSGKRGPDGPAPLGRRGPDGPAPLGKRGPDARTGRRPQEAQRGPRGRNGGGSRTGRPRSSTGAGARGRRREP